MSDIIVIKKVRGYQDKKGVAYLNLEDVSRGLGFVFVATSGNEVIRWNRVRKYLEEMNFCFGGESEKLPEYIPENIFYKLCFKAKNEVARRFQDIVTDEVLPTLRKEGIYTVRKRLKPIDKALKQHMNIAKTIIETTGVKDGIAYAVAIDEAEKDTGYSYDAYKKLLPSATHEIGTMNASMLAEKMNMKAQEVNKLLQKFGYQEKREGNWRLTEKGKEFAEEMPYTNHGHSGYQIKWNENILKELKNMDD